MELIKLNGFCAVTEGSNSTFPRMKLAIRTFFKYNQWFNGSLIVLNLKSNPLSSHNITILNQEYNNIKVIEIDDTNYDKLGEEEKLNCLKSNIFNISCSGLIYFSRNSLFINSIEDVLNEDHISSFELGTFTLNKNIELIDFDSNFMYVPSKYLNNYNGIYDELSNIKLSKFNNNVIIKLFKDFNIPVKKDILVANSSNFPDSKYSNFLRYNKAFGLIIMNSHGPMYKRINMFWLGINSKETNIKATPSKLIINPQPIPNNIDEFDFSISVIIPAYKADPYIEECIKSILNQTFKSNIEILIGIDGCASTYNKVKELTQKYEVRAFYNDSSSVGPYIIRNSLISKAKYDRIIFFDADDVMMPNLISEVVKYDNKKSPIRFKYFNFTHGNDPSISKQKHHDVAHGVFLCPKSTLDEIGGFQPWLCGADTEFMKRCKLNKVEDVRLDTCLFYRRIHSNSLTQNQATNHRSKVREEAKRYINTNRNWSIPISRKIINLIEL